MKKFSMILSMVLALVMLALPMGAMAEPTTAFVIQIANPELSMGEDSIKFDGLAAQVAAVENSDSTLTQLIFDVFAGGQNAGSAMLQLDSDANIVGMVGGMSNAYGINLLEAMDTVMASDPAYAQIMELAAMAETWTLPDEIIAIIDSHMADFTVTELPAEVNADGVEMMYVQITGNMTPALIEIFTAIENDELIRAYLEMAEPGVTMDDLGLVSAFTESGVNINLDATVGTDAYGSVMTADIVLTATTGADIGYAYITAYANTADDGNMVIDCDLVITGAEANTLFATSVYAAINDSITTIVLDANSASDALHADISVVNTDELANITIDATTSNLYSDASDAFYLSGTIEPTATGVKLTGILQATTYGEVSLVTLDGALDMTEAGIAITGTIAASDSYSNVSIDLKASADASGVYAAELTVDDGYGPVGFSAQLAPAAAVAEGAFYSGVLTIAIDDGYDVMNIAADVHLLTADVDTDSFYIAPAAAINLMTMDDTQYNTAMTELNAVLETIGANITNAYPEVFGY